MKSITIKSGSELAIWEITITPIGAKKSMDIFLPGMLNKKFTGIKEQGKEVMNWVVLLKSVEKK